MIIDKEFIGRRYENNSAEFDKDTMLIAVRETRRKEDKLNRLRDRDTL